LRSSLRNPRPEIECSGACLRGVDSKSLKAVLSRLPSRLELGSHISFGLAGLNLHTFRTGVAFRFVGKLFLQWLVDRFVTRAIARSVGFLLVERAERLVDHDVRERLVLGVGLLGPVLLSLR
jgi:hypothetical protein